MKDRKRGRLRFSSDRKFGNPALYTLREIAEDKERISPVAKRGNDLSEAPEEGYGPLPVKPATVPGSRFRFCVKITSWMLKKS